MADVTTGQELNSYQGDPTLGASVGTNSFGYEKADFSPLEAFALNRYKTNQINYQTQEKDRRDLENLYLDPDVNLELDKEYGDQVYPDLVQFRDLMASKPWLNSDRKDYYAFQDKYKEIVKKNSKLKTVQDLKNKYTAFRDNEPNPKKKERYDGYVKELEGFKYGDDIPSYKQYFGFNETDIPKGSTFSYKTQKINGNNLEDWEIAFGNILNLDTKAGLQRIERPEVENSGADLADSLLRYGTNDVNQQTDETRKKATEYYYSALENRMGKDPGYQAFKKNNIGASVRTYLLTNPVLPTDVKGYLEGVISDNRQTTGAAPKGKVGATVTQRGSLPVMNTGQEAVKAIDGGLEYLQQINVVPIQQDGGVKLPGFTYRTVVDPATKTPVTYRLSVNDDQLRAIYGANESLVGRSETLRGSNISKLPAEIADERAAAKLKGIQGSEAQKTGAAKRGLLGAQTRLTNAKADNQIQISTGLWSEIEEGVLNKSAINKGAGRTQLATTDNLPNGTATQIVPESFLSKAVLNKGTGKEAVEPYKVSKLKELGYDVAGLDDKGTYYVLQYKLSTGKNKDVSKGFEIYNIEYDGGTIYNKVYDKVTAAERKKGVMTEYDQLDNADN